MILLKDVSFSYPPNYDQLFKDLDLEVAPSSRVAIIGPDGSGKTTLGKLIKGQLKPDSGIITLGDSSCDQTVAVGYLGGDPYNAMVGVSVEEDIVFGLENLQLPVQKIEARLKSVLNWTGLVGMEKRLVHNLSGGEQQKVVLAACLAMGSKIFIFDEAFSMLDQSARASIRLVVEKLRLDQSLTVIEITHCLEDALAADRIVFLSHGTIEFDGKPDEFMDSHLGAKWTDLSGGIPALVLDLSRRGLLTRNLFNRESLIYSLTNIIGSS
jgi:energy-coupling factor transport system ATP-binding protein